MVMVFFFFQAEDGIRDLVRSRGLGDVYKRQGKIMRRILRKVAADELDSLGDTTTLADPGVVHDLSLIHI